MVEWLVWWMKKEGGRGPDYVQERTGHYCWSCSYSMTNQLRQSARRRFLLVLPVTSTLVCYRTWTWPSTPSQYLPPMWPPPLCVAPLFPICIPLPYISLPKKPVKSREKKDRKKTAVCLFPVYTLSLVDLNPMCICTWVSLPLSSHVFPPPSREYFSPLNAFCCCLYLL